MNIIRRKSTMSEIENGLSKNKICLGPSDKYIFEAVGAYDNKWQAFFDGKKMKKFSNKS